LELESATEKQSAMETAMETAMEMEMEIETVTVWETKLAKVMEPDLE
jgi:hypothetical protein